MTSEAKPGGSSYAIIIVIVILVIIIVVIIIVVCVVRRSREAVLTCFRCHKEPLVTYIDAEGRNSHPKTPIIPKDAPGVGYGSDLHYDEQDQARMISGNLVFDNALDVPDLIRQNSGHGEKDPVENSKQNAANVTLLQRSETYNSQTSPDDKLPSRVYSGGRMPRNISNGGRLPRQKAIMDYDNPAFEEELQPSPSNQVREPNDSTDLLGAFYSKLQNMASKDSTDNDEGNDHDKSRRPSKPHINKPKLRRLPSVDLKSFESNPQNISAPDHTVTHNGHRPHTVTDSVDKDPDDQKILGVTQRNRPKPRMDGSISGGKGRRRPSMTSVVSRDPSHGDVPSALEDHGVRHSDQQPTESSVPSMNIQKPKPKPRLQKTDSTISGSKPRPKLNKTDSTISGYRPRPRMHKTDSTVSGSRVHRKLPVVHDRTISERRHDNQEENVETKPRLHRRDQERDSQISRPNDIVDRQVSMVDSDQSRMIKLDDDDIDSTTLV